MKILLYVIIFLIIICFIPIVAKIEYSESGFSGYIRILFFKIKYPFDDRKNKKGESNGSEKKHGNLNFFKDSIKEILKTSGKLVKKVSVRKLIMDVRISSSDAFFTAMMFGCSSAAFGVLFPFLDRNFKIKKKYITINADFESSESKVYLSASLAIRVMHLIFSGITLICSIIKKSNKERNNKNG